MRERYPELKKRMREKRIRVYAMAEKLGVTVDELLKAMEEAERCRG